jgi:uncharacterized membrane protein
MSTIQSLMALFIFSGVLLTVLSIPLILRKIKPNPFYGFRTPFTLSNETYWYEVNAYGGKWLFGAGIVIAIAAVILAAIPNVSLDFYAIACTLVMGIAMLVGLIMSVMYMRQLRKQTQST